jgi:hypothetical protein
MVFGTRGRLGHGGNGCDLCWYGRVDTRRARKAVTGALRTVREFENTQVDECNFPVQATQEGRTPLANANNLPELCE